MSENNKPIIIYTLPDADGHVIPALQITEQLVKRGFDITVVAPAKWQTAIRKMGANFAPLGGLWARRDFWEHLADKKMSLGVHLGHIFVSMLFAGYQSLVLALTELRHRLGDADLQKRRIVILSDMIYTGVLPFRLGARPFADLVLDVRTICVAVTPRAWAAPEAPCWGQGFPWDPTDAGKKRNVEIYRQRYDAEGWKRLEDALFMCGCTRSLQSLLYDEWERDHPLPEEFSFKRSYGAATYFAHDATLQMTIPSLEYPVPDLPAHFRFAGILPLKPLPAEIQYPEWWGELLEEKKQGRKKIVFVAQGTQAPDHQDLVIPAIQALATRDDVLVVACLCFRGATLKDMPTESLPPNARVVDFIPYDAVLPYADVFASASGYGGLNHAVVNGVPILQTGFLYDKPDLGRRIEYTGIGEYISQFPPPTNMLAEAVDKILSDSSYKEHILKLQAEAKAYNPFDLIEGEIVRLSQG